MAHPGFIAPMAVDDMPSWTRDLFDKGVDVWAARERHPIILLGRAFNPPKRSSLVEG